MTTLERNKRALKNSILLALADHFECGPMERTGRFKSHAAAGNMCRNCGTEIIENSAVERATRANKSYWIHTVCPDLWSFLPLVFDDYDPWIVEEIHPYGLREAVPCQGGCGMSIPNGERVYELRNLVSLNRQPPDLTDLSNWVTPRFRACHSCVLEQRKKGGFHDR